MPEIEPPTPLQRMSVGIDQINGRFAALFQGIVNKTFQTDRFKATKEAVLAAEGLVLISFGATAMQIGEWLSAIFLFVMVGFIFFAKALTLDHWVKNVLGCLGAVLLSALLIAVTVLHKPATDPWSNLQKLWHKHSTQVAQVAQARTPQATIAQTTSQVRPSSPASQAKRMTHTEKVHQKTESVSSYASTPSRESPLPPVIYFAGTTTYDEINEVIQHLQQLEAKWAIGVEQCNHESVMRKVQIANAYPPRKPTLNDEEEDQEYFEMCISNLVGQASANLEAQQDSMQKAYRDARILMHSPGPKQLTPNEEIQEGRDFATCTDNSSKNVSMSDLKSRKVNTDLYGPLIGCWQKLLDKVGDYRQTSISPQQK